MRILAAFALAVAVLCSSVNPALAAPDQGKEKIDLASVILDEIMQIPEQGIPPSLLANAAGIAIIPNVLKVGLVVGGRFGRGVLVLRKAGGGSERPGLHLPYRWQFRLADRCPVDRRDPGLQERAQRPGHSQRQIHPGRRCRGGRRSRRPAEHVGRRRHHAAGRYLFLLPQSRPVCRGLPGGVGPGGGRRCQRRLLRARPISPPAASSAAA